MKETGIDYMKPTTRHREIIFYAQQNDGWLFYIVGGFWCKKPLDKTFAARTPEIAALIAMKLFLPIDTHSVKLTEAGWKTKPPLAMRTDKPKEPTASDLAMAQIEASGGRLARLSGYTWYRGPGLDIVNTTICHLVQQGKLKVTKSLKGTPSEVEIVKS